MKQKTGFLLPLLLAPSLAGADALGVKIGAAYWDYDISGSVRYQSKNSDDDIDVNDDLGYDSDDLTFIYASLEHPVPFLPNVRISRSDIDNSANGRLTQSFTYGDITFTANERVSSEVDLKQTDITLYYEVLDNVVSLDLGLNAKYIDSKARISGEISGTETADVSGWVPMLYGAVGADLPFTGLSVKAEGSIIKYQDSEFFDASVGASYTTPWHVGVDAGYRIVRLDLDDFDDSFADVEFDGLFAGLHASF